MMWLGISTGDALASNCMESLRTLHAKVVTFEFSTETAERVECDSPHCYFLKGSSATTLIRRRYKPKPNGVWGPWTNLYGTLVTIVGEDDVTRHYHKGCPR